MEVRGKGLLVSLPARELRAFQPSGSLYDIEELRRAPLSDDLRGALAAAAQHCKKHKLTLRLVARPEIFTHGAALRWLHERTEGVEDHLCISDGTAVRPIAQMQNHLFLYRSGSSEDVTAFRRLTGWLPELLDSIQTQVNTCFSVRVDRRTITPPLMILQAGLPRRDRATYHQYRFKDAIAKSVEESLRSKSVLEGRQAQRLRAIYVPLTQIAAQSPKFARALAMLIRRTRADARLAVVIGLPALGATATVKDRMLLATQSVRLGGLKPARGVGDHIYFATQDPDQGSLKAFANCELFAHESLSFWRHPRAYYEGFEKIQIVREAGPTRGHRDLAHMLSTAFGRAPDWVDSLASS